MAHEIYYMIMTLSLQHYNITLKTGKESKCTSVLFYIAKILKIPVDFKCKLISDFNHAIKRVYELNASSKWLLISVHVKIVYSEDIMYMTHHIQANAFNRKEEIRNKKLESKCMLFSITYKTTMPHQKHAKHIFWDEKNFVLFSLCVVFMFT